MATLHKVLFILGATGTGKTKLSIDLAKRFSGEIINSDKIQAYKGLDIATNKVSESDQNGVVHHLLGFIENPEEEFSVQDFCQHALAAIDKIIGNGNLPIIVGGSNSYIQALVEDLEIGFKRRFDCCFVWMDVEKPVLYERVRKRIDEMVEEGMLTELQQMFNPEADYTRGLWRAIGAPELDPYLRVGNRTDDEWTKSELLKYGIEEMKVNTCKLVDVQIGKIQRMRDELGWNMHRIDATCVFEKYMNKVKIEDVWVEDVLKPGLAVMNEFLKVKKMMNKKDEKFEYSDMKIGGFEMDFSMAIAGTG